jgi:CubicO group peptidase (beta-lactamase class C family)
VAAAQDRLNHLDQLIREVGALSEGERPWCAGVVVAAGRGPDVLVEEAFGWAVRYAAYDEATDRGVELPRERWVPMRTAGRGTGPGRDRGQDTVFDLASLTKLFTTIVAVRWIERGQVDLDGRVAAYAPEFTAAAEHGITVRQLLTHTSGLLPELPLYDYDSHEQRLARLHAEPPTTAPGTARRYSDLNFLLLQRVVERVTGRSLAHLVRDDITRPLGMTATRYRPPRAWLPRIAATEDQRRPWAKLDRGMLRGVVHDENAYALGGVAGHAGLFSTARDLALFSMMILNGGEGVNGVRIVKPATIARWTARQGKESSRTLGWDSPEGGSSAGQFFSPWSFGHTGFTGTSIWIDPEKDLFVVVLTNRVNPTRSNTRHVQLRRDVADAVQQAVLGARIVNWEAR